jgi:hypothetical protein
LTILKYCKSHIYTDSAKICFTIKDRKERFTFKNGTLQSLAHPQRAYIYEDKTTDKKTGRRRNNTKKSLAKAVKMINTFHTEYDHLLVLPYLLKHDDLGIPMIKCTINKIIFHKTFYDTGSGVNIWPR